MIVFNFMGFFVSILQFSLLFLIILDNHLNLKSFNVKFLTSSRLEQVQRVRPHPLKSGNGCAGRIHPEDTSQGKK